jgi:hypothetical protein
MIDQLLKDLDLDAIEFMEYFQESIIELLETGSVTVTTSDSTYVLSLTTTQQKA